MQIGYVPLAGYANQAAAPTSTSIQKSVSEVDREFDRLSQANERLSVHLTTLRQRLNSVTTPQAPATPDKAEQMAQSVNSPLGQRIRSEALNVENMEASVLALLNSLCI